MLILMKIVWRVLGKFATMAFGITKPQLLIAALISLLSLAPLSVSASVSWDGSIELEQRYFWDGPAGTDTNRGQTSARIQAEVFKEWNNANDNIVFEPFYRYDEQDKQRSHADIRQLIWSHFGENWEFSAGLGRVFWGVTESQHLVDIINQTDGVENIDAEDKLGQPMIRFQYFNNFGNFEAFVLPYFRTRTFAGRESRLNGGIIVDNDRETFESDDEQNNIDFALRYSNTLGNWGVGLSWFSGTSRDPDLFREFDPRSLSTTPYYPQIDQLGTDIQLTTGAWLVKVEAIHRDYNDSAYQDYAAATTGIEYTFTGVFGSNYDIGMLSEYSWDERDERATSLFQNDAFVGARIALNDMSSSEILLGISHDFDDSDSRAIFLEAATRIAPALTANIELRYFNSESPSDLLFGFRDSSFLQIGFEYFFD